MEHKYKLSHFLCFLYYPRAETMEVKSQCSYSYRGLKALYPISLLIKQSSIIKRNLYFTLKSFIFNACWVET